MHHLPLLADLLKTHTLLGLHEMNFQRHYILCKLATVVESMTVDCTKQEEHKHNVICVALVILEMKYRQF